tara:strand:+ start:136 stop:1656 length:1521 start_codon:yes stop_codon:yes gene_type:complete
VKKIVSIETLTKIISKLKKKGKKIILCHGVFDLLHVGHINYFQEAKSYGDILVVSATADQYVRKGPNRPAFNETNRIKALAALKITDYIVLSKNPTSVPIIREIKPNFYCKGPDYKSHKHDVSGEIKNEVNAVKKIGGKTIYTKGATFSSSRLLNEHTEIYNDQQKLFLNKIKKRYQFSHIRELIKSFEKLKVLVIGETIIDQYIFCEALGKSGKEPVLALRDLRTEEYLGGAAALSRHMSTFCNKITLVSMIGEKGDYLNKIKQKLPKNVKFQYIRKKNSPTILKRRFLDNVNKNKVLGVYKINDEILSKKQDKIFCKKLKKMIPKYDLVVVSDYGHGLISKKAASLVCSLSKYSALNAQVNAANVGYHSMRNYKNINCVIINENEIRHEMRNKNDKVEFLMKKLSISQNFKDLIVTRGNQGSVLYNKKNKKINYCGAYAKTAVDKIGAGDAMLSIISMCLKYKFDKDLSLLIGSLAAAQSVETVGNKESINKIHILKNLENILK